MKRQLNREMKKLGFLPEKGREWRNPKARHLARVYTDGKTRIGFFAQGVSKKRQSKMPIDNRTTFAPEYAHSGDAKVYAENLVRNAVNSRYA